VTEEALKLTMYFGERDRAQGRFLADTLLDLYERRGVRASILLRGAEGFGHKQRLQSARRLTLSEDLPVVSIAVDSEERVTDLLDDVTRLSGHGLITLERARLIAAPLSSSPVTGPTPHAKLTVYVGRRQRLCTTGASPGRPCCSASTAWSAGGASGRASWGPTPTCP